MNLDNYYLKNCYSNYNNKTLFGYFRKEYLILTSDLSERYIGYWIDRWIDNYLKFPSSMYDARDSVCLSASMTLEELLD